MTKQAMRQKCKCGKFVIGGWFGDKKTGQPNFSRVSCPKVFAGGLVMCEEHAHNGCFEPQQTA